MRATLLLCDHATVGEGKLNLLGGGWTVTSAQSQHTVALLLDVPWDRANTRLPISLELGDQDGRPVRQSGLEGAVPVRIDGEVEVGRPAGLVPGSAISVPFVFPVTLQLEPGQRYAWRLTVDGETREEWVLAFDTRGAVPKGSGPSDPGMRPA